MMILTQFVFLFFYYVQIIFAEEFNKARIFGLETGLGNAVDFGTLNSAGWDIKNWAKASQARICYERPKSLKKFFPPPTLLFIKDVDGELEVPLKFKSEKNLGVVKYCAVLSPCTLMEELEYFAGDLTKNATITVHFTRYRSGIDMTKVTLALSGGHATASDLKDLGFIRLSNFGGTVTTSIRDCPPDKCTQRITKPLNSLSGSEDHDVDVKEWFVRKPVGSERYFHCVKANNETDTTTIKDPNTVGRLFDIVSKKQHSSPVRVSFRLQRDLFHVLTNSQTTI